MEAEMNLHFRLVFIGVGVVLASFATSFPATTFAAAGSPNIVVILTDDQGWGDLSLNGNTNLSTPNIDQLARDGAMFDRFYVCPVCSPTRAEFLTGRYHTRSGVFSTSAGGERIDLDERTIAETFKAAGYTTAAFGKWHNGMQHPYHPNARGFDEFYGFCSGHWGDYFSPMLEHNGRIVRGDGFVIDDFTNRAMQFIEQHRDEPFFCYLPYNTPHSPMQVSDRWWNKFRDKQIEMHHREPGRENPQHLRAALAMCENIDWNVGRLLEHLDELELAENTIVVYFCDNGPNGARWNGDMKGRKGSTDEGGVRSPCLIRWPDKIASGRYVQQIGAAIDLLPTLAELAGVSVLPNPDHPLDGISLAAHLTSTPPVKDRTIVSHWGGRVSARNQRFRLDNKGQLFDIGEDPGQRTDVVKQHPAAAKQLEAAIAAWKRDTLPDYKTERPFLVGNPDFRHTQVPARDGTAHGNIKRSNRFPNCSFFRNWTSTDDKVTWDIEIGATGDYEIQLYYACSQENIGSTVELSFGDERVTANIETVNDPPLVGAENDRSKRTESYVKDFRPMSLGTMSLEVGQKGTMTLQAPKIPGDEAMEFRMLMLHRVE